MAVFRGNRSINPVKCLYSWTFEVPTERFPRFQLAKGSIFETKLQTENLFTRGHNLGATVPCGRPTLVQKYSKIFGTPPELHFCNRTIEITATLTHTRSKQAFVSLLPK